MTTNLRDIIEMRTSYVTFLSRIIPESFCKKGSVMIVVWSSTHRIPYHEEALELRQLLCKKRKLTFRNTRHSC
ncbi:hypothetical protein ACH3XW_50510 [Acanthocheilonema viteae]